MGEIFLAVSVSVVTCIIVLVMYGYILYKYNTE